jgi:DnaJ-class molecular chaperone
VVRLLFFAFVFGSMIYGLVLLTKRAQKVSGERPRRGKMSRIEAFAVLGVAEGATEHEIMEAYRTLIRKVHPDAPGGSAYLASQLNQARDTLLKR